MRYYVQYSCEHISVIIPKRSGNRNAKRPDDNTVKGVLSKDSSKQILEIIDTWSNCIQNASWELRAEWNIKPEFVFITTTLSSTQQHTDKEIKQKILAPFLADLKKKCNGDINYVWRAEAQPKRTQNIHFHIVVDRYVCAKWVRTTWNRIQDRLGYVERCDYPDPPSTETKRIKSMQNIKSYLAKYLTKDNEQARKIEGKLWGASHALLKLDRYVTFTWDAHEVGDLVHRAEQQKLKILRPTDCVWIIPHNQKERDMLLGTHFTQVLKKHYQQEYFKLHPIIKQYRYVDFSP